MPHIEASKSKTHVIYESNIDCRTIICGCGEKKCRIGISFDAPNLMRFQDKYGNEHAMHLNKKNVKELIVELKSHKFKNKKS